MDKRQAVDERVTERAVISDHRYKGQDNQSPNGWQHVHTSTTAHCDATELLISVWRLAIDQGWIYKTTEYDRSRSKVHVSTCFVPYCF